MARMLPPFLFLLTLPPLAALWALHVPRTRILELQTPPWDVPLALGGGYIDCRTA